MSNVTKIIEILRRAQQMVIDTNTLKAWLQPFDAKEVAEATALAMEEDAAKAAAKTVPAPTPAVPVAAPAVPVAGMVFNKVPAANDSPFYKRLVALLKRAQDKKVDEATLKEWVRHYAPEDVVRAKQELAGGPVVPAAAPAPVAKPVTPVAPKEPVLAAVPVIAPVEPTPAPAPKPVVVPAPVVETVIIPAPALVAPAPAPVKAAPKPEPRKPEPKPEPRKGTIVKGKGKR